MSTYTSEVIYDFSKVHPYAAGSYITLTKDFDGIVVEVARTNKEGEVKEVLWQR